jgi:hypothetical protein
MGEENTRLVQAGTGRCCLRDLAAGHARAPTRLGASGDRHGNPEVAAEHAGAYGQGMRYVMEMFGAGSRAS